MDEDTDHIRIILQYKVSTASHKNTGFLLCQLLDYLRLIVEEILVRYKIITLRRDQISLVDLLGPAEKCSPFQALIRLIEQHLIDPAVVGSHPKDLSAVTVDPLILRVHLTDGLSTASILSCNGYDHILHNEIPLYSPRYAFLMDGSFISTSAAASSTIFPVSRT